VTRNPRDLVRQAFTLAREKGKPDWHRMSLAVLKNRLLDITDRAFSEASYGAGSFKEFVENLSDHLKIDSTTFPPTVELVSRLESGSPQEGTGRLDKSKSNVGPPASIYEGGRIREDLWKAVLDWDADVIYVWNPVQQCVQKVDHVEPDADVLPRIVREEFDVLRAEFVKEFAASVEPQDRAKLEAWGAHKLATTSLPNKAQWYSLLTKQVDSRLQEWLRRHDSLFNKLDHYRASGDTLAIGELLAGQLTTVTASDFDSILANVIANWASVRPIALDVPSTRDLIASIDTFTPPQLARAVIHAASRLKKVGIEVPPEIGDLAFKLLEPLREIFGLSEKLRRPDVISAATAKMDEVFAGLQDAVNGFQRTTSVTAKQPSIEILRQAHRYAQFSLQTELPLLREIDALLGPVFRKFCESCERHDATEVLRRASELRHHLERVQNAYKADAPYALWGTVLSPIFSHVSSLTEEGMRATDQFTAPDVAIVGGTFKLDLSVKERSTTFPVRLRNDGQGMAYGLRLLGEGVDVGAHLELCDPSQPFDLMPKSERLVTLSLTVKKDAAKLSVSVQWLCVTANGKTCEFRQIVEFEQQSSQPDWEELQTVPPYAINPIREKQHLFGRDAVIADLALHVAATTSTFLWGQKRVGKTSVLQVLAAEVSARKDTTCVILRMGELAPLHEGQIAHTIATRLCDAIHSETVVPAENTFGAGLGRLVPFIERLSRTYPKHKFVVIIDEFDDLDATFYTGERGRQFVKALRSLSEVGLAFFFVGSERMNAIYKSHVSDLNKWANYSLDRIQSEDDCAALITKPVKGVIEYHPQAVKSIVHYCGANPFYMHVLCGQLFLRCVQERRTYIGESDVDDVRRGLLRILGPTNFSHFWEDNPELVLGDKKRQAAENCLFLSCIASQGGSYDSREDLLEAQRTLQLNAPQCISRDDFTEIEARLVRRKVIINQRSSGGGIVVDLPIFKDWVISNAESELLPIWRRHIEEQAKIGAQTQSGTLQIFDSTPFPIGEDDLLPVSQKLVYLGKQIDVAEVRRWLRQFDDDSRIEVAFQLLRRLAERGYVSDGAMVSGLSRMHEALSERRTKLGGGAWVTVRRRLDNLCITFVDSETKSGAQTARELAQRMQPGKCGALSDSYGWLQSHLKSDPLLVIADDFSGTGDTLAKGIRRLWQHDEKMLTSLAKEGRIICCLQTAFPEALRHLKSEFPSVEVLVMKLFDDEERACEPEAEIFENEGELKFARDVVLQIGRQLNPQMPLGYGDMAALVAFHNTVPNNTLPIFWCSGTVNNRQWNPILPRASF